MRKYIKALMCLSLLVSPCGFANKEIAYNVLVDAESQNYDIFVMQSDGSNPVNISNDPAIDWVYYSANDLLYFVSDRGQCHRCFYLYEMRSDGSQVRKMTDFTVADSWLSSRKNGTEFIVTPTQQTQPGFAIIDRAGELKQRIDIDLAYASDPAFSPDGQYIVFRGATKASPSEAGFNDSLYIISIDAQSKVSEPQLLYKNPEATEDGQWQGYFAAAPRWSEFFQITFAAKIAGNYDIYSIQPDGSKLTRISPVQSNQVFHDVDRKGDLVFEASNDNHSGYQIYKQSPTGALQQLTDSSPGKFAPVFLDN